MIVVDSGPVIHLSWIDRLDLLILLFEEVFLPLAVKDEVLRAPSGVVGLPAILRALSDSTIQVKSRTGPLVAGLAHLDSGETEAICLAKELNCPFLSDDSAARVAAGQLGLQVSGTAGVLVRARARGVIESAVPLLGELRRHGQWLTDEFIQSIRLREAP